MRAQIKNDLHSRLVGVMQAKLRLMLKKILRKYGYPPDKQEKATLTVLKQAKLLGYEWVT
jgi:type I restriction enzyme R subunit